MSAGEPQGTIDRRAELVKAAWGRIRGRLEDEKGRIYAEIRDYPRPIAACDQQFQFLLDERARICQELDQLDEAVRDSLARGNALGPIDDFLNSSRYLEGDAGQDIRSWFRHGRSQPEA